MCRKIRISIERNIRAAVAIHVENEMTRVLIVGEIFHIHKARGTELDRHKPFHCAVVSDRQRYGVVSVDDVDARAMSVEQSQGRYPDVVGVEGEGVDAAVG